MVVLVMWHRFTKIFLSLEPCLTGLGFSRHWCFISSNVPLGNGDGTGAAILGFRATGSVQLGAGMRILRHYVGLPTVALALMEAGLFLLAMWGLGFIGRCQSCYFDDVVDLEIYEAFLVTGAFLLIVAAVGLYNRDAFLDFRVFAQRFVLASQLVLIPTVAVVGILTVAIAVFFMAIFALRVLLFWTLNVNFLKRRVVILGQGVLADAVSNYLSHEGSSHLRCVGRLAQGQAAAGNTVSLGNIVARAKQRVADAFDFARKSAYPAAQDALNDVFVAA